MSILATTDKYRSSISGRIVLSRMVSGLIVALACVLPSTAAIAAEISLVPDQPEVPPGVSVVIEVQGDFTDESTLGGGMDIAYDPAVLEFMAYQAEAIGDPSYLRDPDASGGLLSGAAFGAFDGISSSIVIAELHFNVRPDAPIGPTQISIAQSAGIAGPFASNDDFQQQTVTFVAAELTIIPVCDYTVISPVSGEQWNVNSVQAIRWQSAGSDCGPNVRLELFNGGVLESTLAVSTENDGTFTWVVEGIPPDTDYTIRVTDLADTSFGDESGAFSIVDIPGFIYSSSFE